MSEGRKRVYALRTAGYITFYEVRANDPAKALQMVRNHKTELGNQHGPLTVVTHLDATEWEEVPEEPAAK